MSEPRPCYDEMRRLMPLEPNERPVVRQMFYTSCPLCGPINDWSDTRADARKQATAHARDHKARAFVPFPLT